MSARDDYPDGIDDREPSDDEIYAPPYAGSFDGPGSEGENDPRL